MSKEFERVFSDLYNKNSAVYENIVRCLAEGVADQDTIAKKTKMQRGSYLSACLDNLTHSGFISREYTWNIKNGLYSKLSHYRLKDNYSRFYLKYIQPNLQNIRLGNFQEMSIYNLPGWYSLMGLQVENLMISNRRLIQRALHIHPSDIVCDNPYFQRKTTRGEGCQIDYMIQTKFNTLFICEIKYSKNDITLKIIDEVKEKIRRLTIPKHYSYRCVLIHANSVSEAVEDCQFFSHILDVTQLISHPFVLGE